jgi:16S rRNA (adenine1518-N6/adenine1519-N6)-dimethyltransferase
MTHRARKRFGQHFLHDPSVIDWILAAIDPQPDQHLVEIGPGKGALTARLLPRCRHLDVIELDRDLVTLLSKRFADDDRLSIHSADALRFDFAGLRTANEKLRLIGNLPYNISTPLLFHLVEHRRCIADMHFMLQKEVVGRLSAGPGGKQYGKLSVMIQYHYQVEHLFDVQAEHFEPKPKVLSAIVRLIPHETAPVIVDSLNMLQRVVTQAFSQRRKNLRNALRPLFSETEMKALNIDPAARAETLGLEEFARLSNYKSKNAADNNPD